MTTSGSTKRAVILLSGTSSSGKSALARALQKHLGARYLHVDGDYFWQLSPECCFDHQPDGTYQAWRGCFLPAYCRDLAK